MEAVFSRDWTVPLSCCDNTAHLGVPDIFAAFMDMAAQHAALLGVGSDDLIPRGLFWLTVRTRVRILRRPALGEAVTLTTWPEPPARLRCNRDYRLTKGDEVLAEGKTEWAIFDFKANRLVPAEGIFPEMQMSDERVCPEPFLRIREDFPDPPFAATVVRSVDIDLGGHMNNVAYVRTLASLFSTKEWAELDPKDVEVCYRSSSYEGNTLSWQKKQTEDGLQLRASLPDGTAALLASLR